MMALRDISSGKLVRLGGEWGKEPICIERLPKAECRERCGTPGRDQMGAGTEHHIRKELREVLGRGDPSILSEQRNDMASCGSKQEN